MQQVQLATRDGELVGKPRHIPSFEQLPQVILWGSRIFHLDRATSRYLIPIYHECQAYYIVESLSHVGEEPHA
jgi:hypothetical protein